MRKRRKKLFRNAGKLLRHGVPVQKTLIFTLLVRHCGSMVITFPQQSAGYTFQYWPQSGYPDCGCYGFPESIQGNVSTVVE
jgi:hypothetical protein